MRLCQIFTRLEIFLFHSENWHFMGHYVLTEGIAFLEEEEVAALLFTAKLPSLRFSCPKHWSREKETVHTFLEITLKDSFHSNMHKV